MLLYTIITLVLLIAVLYVATLCINNSKEIAYLKERVSKLDDWRIDHIVKHVTDNPKDPEDMDVDDRSREDRDHLLLLMAKSFFAADKLRLEKKHPDAHSIILVFQLKNGNIRFSIAESLLPESLRTPTITITSERVNAGNNYRLIGEVINGQD